ncbi:MAG TPA: GNAT family N-acetyltransferase [Streptosporangiaceae bacterium]|jgi:predicted acetyltransferase
MSYPVRTITEDEFEAFTTVPSEAFLEVWEPAALAIERQVVEFDRTIAAFDGAAPVGTASAYSFTMTVPGASIPAAGVTMVSVLPSYRRRGILTTMMRWLADDSLRRGEAVAILFASQSPIYGRFGYGTASWQQRLEIRRGDGGLTTAATEQGTGPGTRLRGGDPGQLRPVLAQAYNAAVCGRAGMLARDDRWWGCLLSDPPALRDGMSPLRCVVAEDDNGPSGFALYRTKHGPDQGGVLRVRELLATTPVATAALWADLLSRDLVAEVVAPWRPVDDPLLAMLAEPRRAVGPVRDGLWVQLTDLPKALSQRTYACPLDVVLEVTDSFLPANSGRWQLRSAGGSAATCQPTDAAADVALPVQALASAYLGAVRFGQLAAAGQVSELRPGALAALSAAMSADVAPWCNMMF